jgi:hypothetical protein
VYITGSLGLPAHNARRDAAGLLGAVQAAMTEWADPTDGLERTATLAADRAALSALPA